MNSTKKAARLAGLLYLGISIPGFFGLMYVPLALYRLFKGVNKAHAALMVALVGVSIPIAIMNELNHSAILTLLSPSGPAAALGTGQTNGLVALFLRQYHDGILIAEIFWGLWLFPLALLVMKSGFLPRILGVLLILAGVGWLAQSVSSLLSPALGHEVARTGTPF